MAKNNDVVNHPAHYQTKGGLEAIDIIGAVTEDLTGVEAFDTGNAVKYLCRWKKKDGTRDLEKAVWYIQHLIAHENDLVKAQVDELTKNMSGGLQ